MRFSDIFKAKSVKIAILILIIVIIVTILMATSKDNISGTVIRLVS
ncbi:hypothetical protein J4471_03600 [Candidatus Woesearchaeota archaeon]|nr:hypothetical protein [Candidatus Woesearchaeota archaeon]